ncbi:hypothetical protein [Chloroflexus sp.]|uniref:hypothetical protein n=1 Tax=Chloroflexus sp. TaxID=1904827 RepID=UPI002ACD7D66|nr:hypothetical protein [Chloroflexus sp.]
MRVTIAASGQGRWQEEIDFSLDCRMSGYVPVLIVFDPTPNLRLEELTEAFQREQGMVYIGEAAWQHLAQAAGDIMNRFIEKYVTMPILHVLNDVPMSLPPIKLAMTDEHFCMTIDYMPICFKRDPHESLELDIDDDGANEDA